MVKVVANEQSVQVPKEEMERRIVEYRQQGVERQAVPHGIYQDPFIVCPWGACGYRIAAIDFQLEKHADPALYARAVAAWWQGPGIVARCPGCRNHVLFSMTQKQPMTDPAAAGLAVLPDGWDQNAYIVA
jgi:hypothetical protein